MSARCALPRVLLLAAALTAAACGDATGPVVAALRIEPDATTLLPGTSVTLRATVLGADSTVLAERAVTWSSSDPGVARLGPPDRSAQVVVTAVARGSARIVATAGGASDTALISVRDTAVTVFVLGGPSEGIPFGGHAYLGAVLRTAAGFVSPPPRFTWRLSDTTVARFYRWIDYSDDSASYNLVEPRLPGAVTVTATNGDAAGSIRLGFVTGPLRSVEVAPHAVSAVVEQTVRVTAVVRNADGFVVHTRDLVWTSSDASVATVVADPLPLDSQFLTASVRVTTHRLGVARIHASIGAMRDSSIVTVTARVGAVRISPSPDTIVVGQAVQLTATATDDAGRTLPDTTVSWSSLDTATATVSGGGPSGTCFPVAGSRCPVSLLGRAAGRARIEATAGSARDTIAVQVVPCAANASCLDSASVFAWLPNSRDLVTVVGTALRVRGRSGADRLVRTVDALTAAVAAAPDGSAFYAVTPSTPTSIGALVRIAADGSSMAALADSVQLCANVCTTLAVAPDGRYVLYRHAPGGDLWTHETSTGRNVSLGVAGEPYAFSPDGRSALVKTGAGWVTVELSTGQRTEVASAYADAVHGVWTTQGIRLLRLTNRSLVIVDPATGGEQVARDSLDGYGEYSHATLSPDLRHVAFWREWGAGARSVGYGFYVFDVATHMFDVGLSHSYFTGQLGTHPTQVRPIFSPDGRYVALLQLDGAFYTVTRMLYAVPVP